MKGTIYPRKKLVLTVIIIVIISANAKPQNLTLEGKGFEKTSVANISITAISPDGRFMAKAHGVNNLFGAEVSSTIQIFDARSFRLLKVITKHESLVSGLEFTPDGKHLISSGKEIYKWNTQNWELAGQYIYNKGKGAKICDFNEDGSKAVLYTYRGGSMAQILDIENMTIINEFKIKGILTSWHKIKYFNDRYIFHRDLVKGRLRIYDINDGKDLDNLGKGLGDGSISYHLPPSIDPDQKLLIQETKVGEYYQGKKNGKAYSFLPKEFSLDQWQWQDNKLSKVKPIITEGLTYDEVSLKSQHMRDMLISEKTGKMYVMTPHELMTYDQNGNLENTILILILNRKKDLKAKSSNNELMTIKFLNDEKHVLIGDSRNVSHIIDLEKQQEIAVLYSSHENEQGYLIVTTDGRMDGDMVTAENLFWNNGLSKIRLSATFDQMYTPNLGAMIFSNLEMENQTKLEDIVRFSPTVSIITPDSISSVNSSEINISVQGIEHGNPIQQFQIFVNDKLISGSKRGFKKIGTNETFSIDLVPGQNTIKAIAISEAGYQSQHDQIIVNFQGTQDVPDLYMIGIGLNNYKNPQLNLNYAIADANAFIQTLEVNGKNIFNTIKINVIEDENATKETVLKVFEEITTLAKPKDVFVFYYAGHGVIGEATPEISSDFYLALFEVTQLYGREEMLVEKGLSAAELRDMCMNIRAQKQVIILDACQSGGAVETFAMRGAAEQKAMMQLARSAGTLLLASTGSEQYAMEFDELGHGVFTYSLIEGLTGDADGGTNDEKITVKELESYLNDRIPILTAKYKGQVQYPMSWSRGQDFPLVIVNGKEERKK